MSATKKHYALMSCPICGAEIKKKATESWPRYFMQTACNPSHAAILRQRKERNKDEAMMALESVIRNWRIA